VTSESPNGELLRRLALNDDRALASVMNASPEVAPKARALFQIAALVASESSFASYKWAVTTAFAEGATEDDIVSVLVSVGPIVGSARTASAAPMLASALGYDVDP
jgi:hypothetical protein